MAEFYTDNCLKIMGGMADRSVDLVFSDPVWNVGKDYGIYKDDLPDDEYCEFMALVIEQAERISKRGVVLFVGGALTKMYFDLMPDARLIIVHKRAAGVVKDNLAMQYHSLFTTATPVERTRDLWEDIRLPGEGYLFKEQRYPHPGQTGLSLTMRVIDRFSLSGETVVDPFAGCGTTAVGCYSLGRKSVGIELNPVYVKIARRRLAAIKEQMRMML